MSTNRNIWVDSADKPNGPSVPMPENHSPIFGAEVVQKPSISIWLALAFCSVPGLLLLGGLYALWGWADYQYQWGVGLDWWLAVGYRMVVVLAFPGFVLGLLVLGLLRGWAAVQQSMLTRLQNNQPVGVGDVLRGPSPRRLQLMLFGLDRYYSNEALWAGASTWRNMNGSWSPTLEVKAEAPAQIMGPALGEAPEAEPTLPPEVPLDGLDLPPGTLGYGMGPGGRLVTAPIGRAYHAVRQGETGSGKTTNINAELVQLHRLGRQASGIFEMYGADFKGEFEATWGRSSQFPGGIAVAPSEIADLLEETMQEVQRRFKSFTAASQSTGRLVRNLTEYIAATEQKLPYRLIYLDEVNVLLGETIPRRIRDRVDAALKRGLQLGRGAGVFYEVGAQYLTSDLFDREGSKQFVTRAYFGIWDVTSMNMIFTGRVDREWGKKYRHLLDGSPGRGVFAGLGGEPIPIQGINVTETEIIDSMRPAPRERSFTAGMPSDSAESTFTGLGETSPVDPSINEHSAHSNRLSNVLAMIREQPALYAYFVNRIRETRGNGSTKKETIKALWGATPGKGEAWIAASAFYDAAIEGAHDGRV